MRKLLSLMLLCVVVAFTSCDKDETPSKPDGFGLQGYWASSDAGVQKSAFDFGELPDLNYSYSVGTLTQYGTYTYDSTTDKLTIQYNMPDAPLETYDIVWVDDTWKVFTLVATGSTPKDKEGTYTLSIQQ